MAWRKNPRGFIVRNGEYKPDPNRFFYMNPSTVTQWNEAHPKAPEAQFSHEEVPSFSSSSPPPLLSPPPNIILSPPLSPPPLMATPSVSRRPVKTAKRSEEGRRLSMIRFLMQTPEVVSPEELPEGFARKVTKWSALPGQAPQKPPTAEESPPQTEEAKVAKPSMTAKLDIFKSLDDGDEPPLTQTVTPLTLKTPVPVERPSFSLNLLGPAPLLRQTADLIDQERRDYHRRTYECPLPYLHQLLQSETLTPGERQELAVLVEAHEMFLWTMIDLHLAVVQPGKQYIEGEYLPRDFVRDIYRRQHELLGLRRQQGQDHHVCRVKYCDDAAVRCLDHQNKEGPPPPDCLRCRAKSRNQASSSGDADTNSRCGRAHRDRGEAPLVGCTECGCNFYGPVKRPFYLRPPPEGGLEAVVIDKARAHPSCPVGYWSELAGLYMPSTGAVFVCRFTGKIHLCGPFCRGSLTEDGSEYACPISGASKGLFTPKVMAIAQKDAFWEVVRHERGLGGGGGEGDMGVDDHHLLTTDDFGMTEDEDDDMGRYSPEVTATPVYAESDRLKVPQTPTTPTTTMEAATLVTEEEEEMSGTAREVVNHPTRVLDMRSLDQAIMASPTLSATASGHVGGGGGYFSLGEAIPAKDEDRDEIIISLITGVLKAKKDSSLEEGRQQQTAQLFHAGSGGTKGTTAAAANRRKRASKPKHRSASAGTPQRSLTSRAFTLPQDEIKKLVSQCMFSEEEYLLEFRATLVSRLSVLGNLCRKREISALVRQPLLLELALKKHMQDLDLVLTFSLCASSLRGLFFLPIRNRLLDLYTGVIHRTYLRATEKCYSAITEVPVRHQNFVRYLALCIHKAILIRNGNLAVNCSMINPDKLPALLSSHSKETTDLRFMETLGYKRTLAGFHVIF